MDAALSIHLCSSAPRPIYIQYTHCSVGECSLIWSVERSVGKHSSWTEDILFLPGLQLTFSANHHFILCYLFFLNFHLVFIFDECDRCFNVWCACVLLVVSCSKALKKLLVTTTMMMISVSKKATENASLWPMNACIWLDSTQFVRFYTQLKKR